MSDERLKSREYVPASESETRNALEAWQEYIDRKLQIAPEFASGGIWPHVLKDDKDPKTIKFSLVPSIAPELAGIGKLNADDPHVYVDGVPNINHGVPWETVQQLNGELVSRRVFKRNEPSTFTTEGTFGEFVAKQRINPGDFLLWIYSANDFDQISRRIRNEEFKEIVFFRNSHGTIDAYTINFRQSLIRYMVPLRAYRSLIVPLRKQFNVQKSTQQEIGIIEKGFREATQRLKGV